MAEVSTEEKVSEVQQVQEVQEDVAALQLALPVATPTHTIQASQAQTRYNEGLVALEEQDLDTAIACFSRAIFLDPDVAEYYAARGEVYLHLCDLNSAFYNYRHAHKVFPSNESFLTSVCVIAMKQALIALNEERYADSLQLLAKADQGCLPQQYIAYTRALCYVGSKDLPAALYELERAIQVDGRYMDALILKAKLLWETGQTLAGNNEMWKAHAVDHRHPDVDEFLRRMKGSSDEYYMLATRDIFMGDVKRAFQHLQVALEFDHNSTKVLLLKAGLYRRQKQFEDALRELELATRRMHEESLQEEVNRQISLTYNDMALHLFKDRLYEDAIVLLNEAIAFDKKEVDFYISRADCFRELKKYQQALADYHFCLELQPSHAEVENRLAYIHNALGVDLYNEGGYEQAQVEFTRAIHYRPQNAEFFVNRGRAAYHSADMDQAFRDYKSAVAIDPYHAEAQTWLEQFLPTKPSPALPAGSGMLDRTQQLHLRSPNTATRKPQKGVTVAAMARSPR